jgi:DNA-binding transcriptional LysR family regulator
MNLTVRQLQAFVLVARLGSFTQAAKAMHVTQSALSVLMRELEGSLHTRLMDRTTRSVQLTAVGTEFLASAQRILDDLEHAVANVDKLVAQQKGRVVVAAPLVLAGTFLPPIIAAFKARFPGIDLVVQDSLPDQVLPSVRTNLADIGIGTFDQTEPELQRVTLFEEAMVAVFPHSHRFASVRRLTWRHLRDVPVLTLPRNNVFRELAERGYAAAGFALRPAFEASYVGTVIGLVAAGLGVGVVPSYATELADKSIVSWKPLNAPVITREVSMVHRAGMSVSPASKAFMDFVAPPGAAP